MPASNKVIILGLDGLDPALLNKYISQDLLPNFKKLSQKYFSPLATSTPPQSPVAWSNFITGTKTENHQIFDFITRDPNKLIPHLTFSHALNKKNPLKATPFWQKSLAKNIPSQVLFLPNTFPLPKNLPHKQDLHFISGMGTPGLDGTESTCHFYSTDKNKLPQESRSHLIHLKSDNTQTIIRGPRQKTSQGLKPITIPLNIKCHKNNLHITVQDQAITLKPNQLSKWLELKFSLNIFKKLHGITRFYLKSLNPFQLYLAPINFHPQKPPFPISIPKQFSTQLTNQFGLYSTLGLPNDTWALEHDFLTPKAFLKIAHQVIDTRESISLHQLKNFSQGLFVAYFNTPDPIQHMFWKNQYLPKDPHQKAIQNVYQRLDKTLHHFVQQTNPNDLLLVLSDHGFASLNYHVHLNNLFLQHDLLSLKNPKKDNDLLENTNWQKTSCYAIGFNSVFLNLKGREKHGQITQKQKQQTINKITNLLQDLTFQGQPVVKQVYTPKSSNPTTPDLIVGYQKGFRASWQTAVGNIGPRLFTKNKQKWSGDHLFNPDQVPGILLSNQNLNLKNPAIQDLTPLALKYLQ